MIVKNKYNKEDNFLLIGIKYGLNVTTVEKYEYKVKYYEVINHSKDLQEIIYNFDNLVGEIKKSIK